MGSFDFDYWKNLAESDPAAFFRARDRYLHLFIAAHPEHQASLIALQARIDTTRAMAGSPMQACRGILSLLEDHLLLLGETLAELRSETVGLHGMLSPTAC